MPSIWRPYARADVISHPLNTVSILFAGENVEAKFRPIIDPLRQFQGLVLLMIGWVHALKDFSLSGDSVVGMQFDHEVLGWDSVRAIDLNLIVTLSRRNPSNEQEAPCNEQQSACTKSFAFLLVITMHSETPS
jgi:hypothetical protein